MRILKENTLAISIDFQEKLLPVMREPEALLENTKKLIQGLNTLSVEIIFTRQYPEGLGDTISELKAISSASKTLDKSTFSAYDEEIIIKELDSQDKKNIIIFGIESHVCVLQSIIDLQANGYQCILITDCISSRKKHDFKMALERAKFEGAILSTYESILFELTRNSVNKNFRTISGIIK